MNLHQIVLGNVSFLGISSKEPRFNAKSVLVFLMFGIAIVLLSSFLVLEANTFKEYTFCIYILTGLSSMVACFTVVFFKKEKISKLIANMENFLQESKLLGKMVQISHRKKEIIPFNYSNANISQDLTIKQPKDSKAIPILVDWLKRGQKLYIL